VLDIATGAFVSNFTVVGVGFQPGAGGYFPGRYDPTTMIKCVRGYNAQTNQLSYFGISLANPTAPTIAWQTFFDESGEDLSIGGGLLLIGTVNGAIIALNDSTGVVQWRTSKVGFAQYTATYIASDNTFIQGSASTTLTCYNATNGDVLWDEPQGGRAFFAFAGATDYGRFYQHNIALPQGYIGCWDVTTGNLLWKEPALYEIGYLTPVVADGKLYVQQYELSAGGVSAVVPTFSCFDAFTGQLLWQMSGISIVNPSIAYGNLYAIINNYVYCFSSTPQDWNEWRGSTSSPGITQNTGPDGAGTNGFIPTWSFATGGPVSGSTVVVNGMVYFGSQDDNIYCLNAYTGAEIWNFTTGYRVFSTPAVFDGVLYTGSDDGYIYALNANTGQQIWKTLAGGLTNYTFAGTWQPRSSPVVVNGNLYVGALDGNLYCLSITNGAVLWKDPLGNSTNPIGGSPAYSGGDIYICALNHNLYKIDASSGNIIWTATSNATIARAYTNFFPWSTPVVFNNTVYWGGGPVYGRLIWYALNATTGEQIWQISGSSSSVGATTYGGNTPTCQTPVVFQWNSTLSVMIVGEDLGVSIRNANNGSLIWYQFLGHEVYSSVGYSNATGTPLFYVGCSTYSITCFNATAAVMNQTANAVLAVYTTLSQTPGSPSIWNGMLFMGSDDYHVYMFHDTYTVPFTIFATSSKGSAMWNNETDILAGTLRPTPTTTTYGSTAANGLPNATVTIEIVQPDNTSLALNATTDPLGNFEVSFSPTEVGTYSWLASYAGESNASALINGNEIYSPAYTQYSTLSVTQAPVTPTPTPVVTSTPTAAPTATPSPSASASVAPTSSSSSSKGISAVYIYVIVAVIIIIVIAVAAYLFTMRGKKPAAPAA
jgi:outer membrane protein assembly factor BamB